MEFNMYRIEFQGVTKWQMTLNRVFIQFSKWRLYSRYRLFKENQPYSSASIFGSNCSYLKGKLILTTNNASKMYSLAARLVFKMASLCITIRNICIKE